MIDKFFTFINTHTGHAIGCAVGVLNIISGLYHGSVLQIVGGVILAGVEGYDLYRKLER